ncbi:MAG: hypothetical protein KKD63_08920 [Proteobacteria bacterium]|nr:hypothetical protein [Desulfobulbaceae bacterium]MBU4152990.1 hypothetical protein [Pseudomonadota bacterium]
MKKMFLTASLLSMLAISLPVLAEEAHHPKNQAAPEMAQMNTEKVDTSMQQMQEMRNKIETEKDPAARKELMHQHMKMMRDGMNMMKGQCCMMSDKGKMMGGESGKSMEDHMKMMENKMMMMQEMMNGMMTQHEMMMK